MAGPQKKFCGQCGATRGPDSRFCKQCGLAFSAAAPSAAPAAPPAAARQEMSGPWEKRAARPDVIPSPASMVSPKAAPCRKKRGGCLGCLGKMLLVLVLAGGLGALVVFIRGRQPSRNIVAGTRVAVARENVGPEGGRIAVDGAGPLKGFAIDVPEGAYPQSVSFDIGYQPIREHNLGPDFHPVTPLISVQNGGGYAEDPVTVTIPVPDDPDKFAMAFYYDRRSGRLEGLPLAGADRGSITVVTRHFSDVVVSSIDIRILQGEVDVDTGFKPGFDDWQFTNHGSFAAPVGHCAGQSISAMWYFYEKRPTERCLYGRYDNNDRGYGTIDFWPDDSWGYRLASAVQRDCNWDRQAAQFMRKLQAYQDRLTMNAFRYSMLLTRSPQYIALASSTAPNRHAIIAYRIASGLLYVADPNYPGTERFIRYEDGRFLPYNSGDNATAIAEGREISYDRIGYSAASALVDWPQVARRWGQLKGGVAGDDYFDDAFTLKVLEAEGDPPEEEWVELADGYETDEGKTALPRPDLRGRIAVALFTPTPGRRLSAYRGTRLLTQQVAPAGSFAIVELELEKGVNDLGFLVEQEKTHQGETKWRYVDFQRVTVKYEEVDLAGRWKGTLVIEESEKLMRFLEEIAVWLVKGITGEADEQKIRQNFRDQNKTPPEPKEFILQLESVPGRKDAYDVFYYDTKEDGDSVEYRDRAAYKDGVLSFRLNHPDGADLVFEGRLKDNQSLYGTFSANLWIILRNAISGRWEVDRTD